MFMPLHGEDYSTVQTAPKTIIIRIPPTRADPPLVEGCFRVTEATRLLTQLLPPNG